MKGITCLILLAVAVVALDALKPENQGQSVQKRGRSKQGNQFCKQYKKHKDVCDCANQVCLCCFTIPGLNYKSCIKTTQVKPMKMIKLDLIIQGVSIVNEEFRLSPKTEICGQLAKRMSGIDYCITQTNVANPDGTLSACTSLNFQAAYEPETDDDDDEDTYEEEDTDNEAEATIRMHCLTVEKTGLTVETTSSSMSTSTTSEIYTLKATSNFNRTITKIRKKLAIKKLRYE